MTLPNTLSRACSSVAAVALLLSANVHAQWPTDSSGPLHTRAARADRHLKESISFDVSSPSATLEELRARSDSSIVGRVISIRCRPDKDKRHLETHVTVMVQSVLSGPLVAGQLVELLVPGGAFRFSDGVAVEQRVTDYRLARVNRSYALMLDRPGTIYLGRPVVTLSGGAQSQFELDFETDQVEPATLVVRDPMRMRYRGMRVSDFLAEFRAK